MKLTKSRSQYHRNGVRISKALYEAILHAAMKRGDVTAGTAKHGMPCHWVRGITAYVYGRRDAPSRDDWAEALLDAGEIESLADYKD